MIYLMSDAGKVHTNPDPSQSSISWSVISGSRNTNAESRLVRHTTLGAVRLQTKLVIKQQHCVLHGKAKALTHWPRAPLFPVHTQVNQAEGTASLRGRSFVSWRQHLRWALYIDRSAHPFRILWLKWLRQHIPATRFGTSLSSLTVHSALIHLKGFLMIKYQLLD